MDPRRLRALSFLSAASVMPTLCGSALPQSGVAPPHYEITKSVELGAPDHWDYVVVDAETHRVYVAHGDRVAVVDARSGAVLGKVEGFPGGTHGIAVVNAFGRGYTDDGAGGKAASFDLKTFKVIKRIDAAEDADAVTFDPVSGHVFVINGHPGTVTVIDPKRDVAVATVSTGDELEYAVAGDDGKIYINGASKKEILRLDTKTNRIDGRWPVDDCEDPHGLAIDTASRRLFTTCLNAMLVVVNIDSGAKVAALPIGKGSDAAAFDPKRKLIFSSNGRDGTLSVIQEKDPQTFVSLGTVKTAMTARTMGIDPNTGRIYLAAAEPRPGAVPPAGSALAPPPVVPGSLKLLFLDPAP
jgi:DNA-binding beta-propeller fold protein YncE